MYLEQLLSFIVPPSMMDNDFLTGGMYIGAFTMGIAILRGIVNKTIHLIKLNFIVTATFKDIDNSTKYIYHWLSEQPYTQKCKRLSYIKLGDDYTKVPGPGTHYFFFNKTLLKFHIQREEKQVNGMTLGVAETLTINYLGLGTDIVDLIVSEGKKIDSRPDPNVIEVVKKASGYWIHSHIPTRCIDSVFLPKQIKDEVIDDILKFKKSKDWYFKVGAPYKRVYLFHGPPGNGKTSLIKGIASEIGANLYPISISSSLTAADFMSIVSNAEEDKSIIVLEDIDCGPLSLNRKAPKKKNEFGLTLQILLNVLDGLDTPQGMIMIITTNHPESLDPAIRRPGRMDKSILFSNPMYDDINHMCKYMHDVSLPLSFKDKINSLDINMSTYYNAICNQGMTDNEVITAITQIIEKGKNAQTNPLNNSTTTVGLLNSKTKAHSG